MLNYRISTKCMNKVQKINYSNTLFRITLINFFCYLLFNKMSDLCD